MPPTNDTEREQNAKAIWVFTPSRSNPKDLEFILVQRQQLLQDAVERVKESALTDHKHHLLFVGPRGCGKTHLVTLIVSRLGDADELTDRLRIAWLNEDETCTTLLELLFKIHSALEKRYPNEYRESMLDAAYDLKPAEAKEFMTRHLLATLGQRTLLVVTENLDAIFEGLGDVGQKQLRSFIQENPKLTIVATAQRLVEDLSSRTSPFFGFFQTEHLKPLNVDQANELLQNIARLQDKHSVVEFLATSRGRSRVRAIHHLSGGNHRIYIVLSQFITRDSIDALLGPFMKMVDELTPYYQERIRWLPPQQRKIVEYLCSCEGTVPVKELARRLFASQQTISSQLKDLREKGYVEAHQRGRESLYEISEPLMRICVEVKENQRHQPLRLLVDFLRVWYDDQDLQHRLGSLEPASASCAYLQSAIQRNSTEGNLRKKILLDDFQASLPEDMDPAFRSNLIQELKDAPEAVVMAIKSAREGNTDEAFSCLAEGIAHEASPSVKAEILFCRAGIHSSLTHHDKEIDDYTAIIELAGLPDGQLARALLNRGIMHGKSGGTQLAINDYTVVISLSDAPVKQVAKAHFKRGVMHSQSGDTQLAIDDYTAAAEHSGSSIKQVANAFFNRGIAHGQSGATQLEISDYTAVIELAGAPVELISRALINRGHIFSRSGETASAISDYTAVIELPGAPVEQIAMAHFNRGNLQGQSGETAPAINDYTAVTQLSAVPVALVANALFNRGIIHGQTGATLMEIADHTAVIELSGASVELITMALINRGIIHSQLGNTTLAFEDYTTVIDLSGAPPEMIAMALISRGLIYSQSGKTQISIGDWSSVIGLSGAPINLVATAFFFRGVANFRNQKKQESQSDFEALISLPGAPLESVVDANLALAELHFSEGRWSQGFLAIEAGLECGSRAQPTYYKTTADLIGVIFSAGLNPDRRRETVGELLRLYSKYQALSVLGEAAVQHIGSVFRAGKPFPSVDNLEAWACAWEQAAQEEADFRLSARLLRTGINYVKAGGEDEGLLLDLTSTERSILRQALGLVEEGAGNAP